MLRLLCELNYLLLKSARGAPALYQIKYIISIKTDSGNGNLTSSSFIKYRKLSRLYFAVTTSIRNKTNNNNFSLSLHDFVCFCHTNIIYKRVRRTRTFRSSIPTHTNTLPSHCHYGGQIYILIFVFFLFVL